MISKGDYKDCLQHIQKKWSELTFQQRHDFKLHIGLPHRAISPNNQRFQNQMFYWDSYFIIVGLMASHKQNIALGILENCIALQKKYGLIPGSNMLFKLAHSQPPFLTSMIMELYSHNPTKSWLKSMAFIATQELKEYWEDEKHLVHEGLSRYADHSVTHLLAEHESGWDTTSRFRDHCADMIPIDLNCCLHKYETDLAKMYEILGDNKQHTIFKKAAAKRKKAIRKLLWDDSEKFFFDYDFQNQHPSKFYSLAGYFALWAEVASKEEAAAMVKHLDKFETKGGLTTTQKTNLLKPFRQWDHPNGWAPLHLIVIEGLRKYGYDDDAQRIAKKWLDCNYEVWKNTGELWEKYDVVHCLPGREGRYTTEPGFAWTNAVFVKLVKELAS